jgi:hypothetical protein
LQQPSGLGWNQERPHAVRVACHQHSPGRMDSDSIKKENRLISTQMWPQSSYQQLHHLSAQELVVPRALLSHEYNVGWASCSQGRHVSHQEGRFVADDKLWQERLQLRHIADEGDVGQAASALATGHVLHRLTIARPLFTNKNCPLAIALEQTERCLVQVNPQHSLADWHLAAVIVEPLPRRHGLNTCLSYVPQNRCTLYTKMDKPGPENGPELGAGKRS